MGKHLPVTRVRINWWNHCHEYVILYTAVGSESNNDMRYVNKRKLLDKYEYVISARVTE